MSDINFNEIEKKWRSKWESSHIYEVNPSDVEKRFLTAAFPYPNSPQHIGHGRTYTITDVYARYLRMKGFNVLFPMAFHVTGTPVLAMAERIKEGDEELLNIFEKIYGIPRDVAVSLTNPKDLVLYFSREIEEGMKEMGFAIDWRRKFYTFDKHFNKFIEWQFRKLKEKGYLVKGEHPVPWSKKLNSAVGAHDTKGDVDPELEEVVAIKFKYKDGYIVVSTYRPETIYGVTNLWVNPDAMYVKVKDKASGEFYYMAKDAADNLSYQFDFEVVKEIKGSEFINKKAVAPLVNREVPIYPAYFVKPDEGTGAVMSVPAHAPFDYIAMRDLGIEDLISIISVKDFGEFPAKEIVEKLSISNQNDTKKLEEATKIIYKAEAHTGKMKVGYEGMPVSEAKEKVKEDMIRSGDAFTMWIIANGPVYTREGDKVIVKKVKDQWFIDYGNREWKEKTRKFIEEELILIPPDAKKQLLATVDWLERKACTRARGLGTKFPFDESQMIESLSDSTIYMAFYTIAHKIKEFSPDELDESFFDYLFLGKGEPKNDLHREMREEFLYWYPLDSRHTGADLLRNHLVFFIMNHIAIFPKELWPKQIVVNGFVLMDGKKMSKSLGNILPLRKAIREFGADIIRFSVVSGAELMQDTDFNRGVAEGIKSRLSFFFSLLDYADTDGNDFIDEWLMSRINSMLVGLDDRFRSFNLRSIALDFFYNLYSDVQWYLRRKKGKKPGLKTFLNIWTRVMAPFIPYTAEEMWHALGNDGSVFNERIPMPDEGSINKDVEIAESVVVSLRDDMEKLISLVKSKGKSVSKAYIYIPEDWKFEMYNMILEDKNVNRAREFVRSLGGDRVSVGMKTISQIVKRIHSLREAPKKDILIKALNDAANMLSDELSIDVEILNEENALEAHRQKALMALPLKPAILLE